VIPVTPLVPASPEQVLATLRRCAQIGPFFAVGVGDIGGVGDPPWCPATALLSPTDELRAVIAAVRTWAGDPEPRVAASLFLLSYSGRLLSAAIAGVLLDGVLLDLRAHGLHWRYEPGVGVRLRVRAAAGWLLGGAPWDALGTQVVDEQLGAVVSAIRAVVFVSPRLLWGNITSSAAGALQSLAATGAVPLARCREAGEALLAHPRLHDTGEFPQPPAGARPRLVFNRRSCCLYYRLAAANGAMCGDCVLLRSDERASRWRE
jgi:ferric iron reductase protein FhuF